MPGRVPSLFLLGDQRVIVVRSPRLLDGVHEVDRLVNGLKALKVSSPREDYVERFSLTEEQAEAPPSEELTKALEPKLEALWNPRSKLERAGSRLGVIGRIGALEWKAGKLDHVQALMLMDVIDRRVEAKKRAPQGAEPGD